jgi:hypothetical protein
MRRRSLGLGPQGGADQDVEKSDQDTALSSISASLPQVVAPHSGFTSARSGFGPAFAAPSLTPLELAQLLAPDDCCATVISMRWPADPALLRDLCRLELADGRRGVMSAARKKWLEVTAVAWNDHGDGWTIVGPAVIDPEYITAIREVIDDRLGSRHTLISVRGVSDVICVPGTIALIRAKINALNCAPGEDGA